jgi:hypothetical protein
MKHQVHHPQFYAAVKTAFGGLVRAVGGFEAAGACVGAAPSRLHAMADLRQPDFPRADYVADLEHVAMAPLLTSVLAGATHHRLLPLPEAVQGTEPRAIAATLREAAELGAEFAEAMEDGRLADAERTSLIERLASVARAADAARTLLAGPVLPIGTAKLREPA